MEMNMEISSMSDLTLWIIEKVVTCKRIHELIERQKLISKVVKAYETEMITGKGKRGRLRFLEVNEKTSEIKVKSVPWK